MVRKDDNACRLNNRERELWISNDEGLYRWMRSEQRQGGGMRGFIKRNKAEIDKAICRALGREPLAARSSVRGAPFAAVIAIWPFVRSGTATRRSGTWART